MQSSQSSFFDKDLPLFLKNLEKNNNRDWFNENKKLYTSKVKEPFDLFVKDLILKAQTIIPNMENLESKDCIFRIYRDVRFSKDKRPYKAQVSAIIGPMGRKDMSGSGYYLEINPTFIRVYSGIYMPSTQQRLQIREYIAKNTKELNKLKNSKEFKDTFGEIRGEKAKRIPKELRDAAEQEPLIMNKQFYFFTEIDIKNCLNDDFSDQIHQLFLKTLPMNTFLLKSINR